MSQTEISGSLCCEPKRFLLLAGSCSQVKFISYSTTSAYRRLIRSYAGNAGKEFGTGQDEQRVVGVCQRG